MSDFSYDGESICKGADICALPVLNSKAKNGLQDSDVEWNFQKYLINENGELDQVIKPQTLPTDPSVINWIKAS
jgi:glutathione peroxidase